MFEALSAHPELNGWPGLGIVVQAYAHTLALADWLERKACKQETKLPFVCQRCLLDTEIKLPRRRPDDFAVHRKKSY